MLQCVNLAVGSVMDKKGAAAYTSEVTRLLAILNGKPAKGSDPKTNRKQVMNRLLAMGAKPGWTK